VNYGVDFDIFAKVEVNGENACDLYRFLTSLDTRPRGAGKIRWNFEKFILDRNGFVVARFGSATKPDAPEIVSVIERELAKNARSVATEASHPREHRHTEIADYRWKNRIVLLFAPERETCESFRRAWKARAAEVAERDLLLIEVSDTGEGRVGDAYLAPTAAVKIRSQYQVQPGSVTTILVGKDGREKMRGTNLQLDRLFDVIDAMPMRQEEMRRQRQQSR
jgi:hypothetical protein